MSDRDVAAAVERMEQAWAKRRRTLESLPDSEVESRQYLEEVRESLVEAVAICREIGAQRQLVDALRKLGHVEQDLGREETTLARYEEAVSVSRGSGDSLLLAHSVRHLGDVRRSSGQLDAAEECYAGGAGSLPQSRAATRARFRQCYCAARDLEGAQRAGFRREGALARGPESVR